eukprot:jgi/Botrbrau1/10677/Bobra.139_2s0007.1
MSALFCYPAGLLCCCCNKTISDDIFCCTCGDPQRHHECLFTIGQPPGTSEQACVCCSALLYVATPKFEGRLCAAERLMILRMRCNAFVHACKAHVQYSGGYFLCRKCHNFLESLPISSQKCSLSFVSASLRYV